VLAGKRSQHTVTEIKYLTFIVHSRYAEVRLTQDHPDEVNGFSEPWPIVVHILQSFELSFIL
jgi:hypothetical protein